MEQLIKKYRLGTLTPAELAKLREMADTASDADLADMLTATPVNDPVDPDDIPASRIHRMKSVIDRATDAPAPWWRRTATVAAAVIVLPIVSALFTLQFLVPATDTYMSTAITTGPAGESMTQVNLPDGSSVLLGENSSVEMLEYTQNSRTVRFNGTAYFNVARIPCPDNDGNLPFLITAPGMEVNVTGTSFSIAALDSAATSMLSLDSGSVSLTAETSMNTVSLTPGQRIILNRIAGTFEIDSIPSGNGINAWTRRELTFDHAGADEIAATLNATYGISLDPTVVAAIDTPFSGTLPANDLASALTILSRIYSFRLPYNPASR